jgi:hypothetical protein
MKANFLATMLVAASIVADVSGQSPPAGAPAVVYPAPAPVASAQPLPPPGGVYPVPAPALRDGPYRVLVTAKTEARHRRLQGFKADVVNENGKWWVYYHY